MRRTVLVPTSRLRLGHARTDITPPVGIYHRTWGAARHDRASGVHQPLLADVLAFGALDSEDAGLLRVHLDLCALGPTEHARLCRTAAAAAGLPVACVVIACSHTHSSGWFPPDRLSMPGGELIPAYLERLNRLVADAAGRAVPDMRPATVTYGAGRCALAANRDYLDPKGGFVCGFNPDAPADETLVAARVSEEAGRLRLVLMNYGCHPTSLAWENSLISPDFPGEARAVVESALAVPCVYAQGACGDLGPREGFSGDPAVAERNGRILGYSALSVLAGLLDPEADIEYAGPVVSGATLGTWRASPHDADRVSGSSHFRGTSFTVDLPLKPRPERTTLEATLERELQMERAADECGQAEQARDHGARAERARRWLARLADLPAGATYPLACSAWRLGDAVWLTTGGEPYSRLQQSLRARFPERTLLFSPLCGDLPVAYLLERELYGTGRYQEECSILAPGCLEILEEELAERISAL